MDVLNFIAGLASIFLAFLVMLIAILFAGVCFGLWFGLRFADRKSDTALEKANQYIATGRKLERTYLGYLIKPMIEAHVLGETVGATIITLIARARERSTVNES